MYDALFSMYAHALQATTDARCVVFDFSNCSFLHQNGVALLGGLIRELQYRGCTVEFAGCIGDVQANLRKNGFLQHFGLASGKIGANTIPFRHDPQRADDAFLVYLREDWLGRKWVDVSERLSDAIANAVWESYTNAFEHSRLETGVFTCGQFYPKLRQIELTIVDFGIGIPETVRTVERAARYDDSSAIAWALGSGNTSKRGNRGMGLEILSSFIALNDGKMDVVSHHGHITIDRNGRRPSRRRSRFKGTLVNVLLNADESRYGFRDEMTEDPLF